MDGILSVTIQMKATEQYSHVVLLTILYKVVLTFEYENGNILTVTIQKLLSSTFPLYRDIAVRFCGAKGSDCMKGKTPKSVIQNEVI